MAQAPKVRGSIDTREDMRRAGYMFVESKPCRTCSVRIELWRTTHGKFIAFNPIATDYEDVVAHHKTCQPAARAGGDIAAMQKAVQDLCRRFPLRAAVLLHEGGSVYSYRLGIPGEDLRMEMITAGNTIRADIEKGKN